VVRAAGHDLRFSLGRLMSTTAVPERSTAAEAGGSPVTNIALILMTAAIRQAPRRTLETVSLRKGVGLVAAPVHIVLMSGW